VGIATGYGLDGPGIESRWGEILRTCPDRPWDPPSLLYKGTGSFPGVESGRGVTLTPHPLLMPRSRMSGAVPLLPLWAFGACYRANFTFYKFRLSERIGIQIWFSLDLKCLLSTERVTFMYSKSVPRSCRLQHIT
jgi:hypothetical protein